MTRNKRQVSYPVFAILLALSLVLGACTTPTPAPTSAPTTEAPVAPTPEPTLEPFEALMLNPLRPEDLSSGTWQWVGGREAAADESFMVDAPENYTVTFNADGTINFQADCNVGFGEYTFSGNDLSVTPGGTTRMACPEGSMGDQFTTQLGQASQVGFAFGSLVILLADGGELYFQGAPEMDLGADLEPIEQDALVDTVWQWTSILELADASQTEVYDPENYNIVFRADGSYSARADCNQLMGTYELDGDRLTLMGGASTLAACPEGSLFDQYMAALTRVTNVGMRDGLLVMLLDDAAGALEFEDGGNAPAENMPVVIEGDPATLLGRPDFVDNFGSEANWTMFDVPCFTSQITAGQFLMTANGQAQSVCWTVTWPQIQNFYIETTLEMPDACVAEDRFGLFFRAPDTNRGYMYGFTCNGQYVLSLWDGSLTTTLVEPTASQEILSDSGAINRMGLLVFGEHISLYANGVHLATVSDSTFLDAGRVGYFVRAATDAAFTSRYNQLRIWTLEDELFPPEVESGAPEIDLEAPASTAPTGEARVNANVRTGPSVLFPIIATARQGDTGEVLGINPGGTWYAVRVPTTRVGSGVAWISGDLVILTNATIQSLPVITPPLLPTLVNFPAPAANARQVMMTEAATLSSGPSVEFPVFGVAPHGSRAEVTGESEDGRWWQIRVATSLSSDGFAWVAKTFTNATSIGGTPVVRTPNLPNSITPAAPGSGAPSLITIEPLNVRTGPGNEFRSLGHVARGTVLAVVGVSPDREHFIVNVPESVDRSGRGWVPARFVQASNVSSVPVVQPPAP